MRPTSSDSSQPRTNDHHRRHRGGAGGRASRAPNRGGGGGGTSGGGGCRQAWLPRGSSEAPVVSHRELPHQASLGRGNDPNPILNNPPAPISGRGRPRQHHVARHYQAPKPPPPQDNAVAAEHGDVPQLVQEIQDKLARGALECMICYDMVRRSAAVWSCHSCFSIFHLNCIKKWARSPTSTDTATADGHVNWRCPGCQSVQLTPAKDLQYTCFCERRRDPPNDLYLTPHSCGEPCGKPLDRSRRPSVNGSEGEVEDSGRCPHLCVLQCHPGPCPPCKAFAPRCSCPCGKQTIVRRCSDRNTLLTCGQPCDRLLSCGRHRCGLLCHTGPCEPCQVLMTASCFCKKNTEMVLCGDMVVKGEINEATGIFSCNSICVKARSCGNHFCNEVCHPGPCGECQLLPHRVKTCHCGKTELKSTRGSCLDPIPTCSEVCGKLLPCKLHRCTEYCHEGDCPPCLIPVSQKCRCGSTSQMIECFKALDDKDMFVCERPCGRKKNCGRHRCSERCCPLSSNSIGQFSGDWDPHLCQMPCGKKLRCGQHSCQLLCHSGHCPPCLETIFSDLTCACGRTSLPPPLPCGTPYPSCPHPCVVPQPCGHAATHTCHFGDCPPCSVPVAKECIGGHVVLRNIPCGSRDIRCNQLCGKTRQCGMHACARTCHPAPCDSSSEYGSNSGSKASCGQTCGAPRRDCRHTCTALCHPSVPCPDIRCEFLVQISCSCGRITANVPCGAGGSVAGFNGDSVYETTVIQKLPAPLQPMEANEKRVPFGQRKLACDEECEKMERKRVLAEAFDVTPPSLDALHFGESAAVSDLLNDFFRRDPKWVMAVEERFKFLVVGKMKGSSANSIRVHVFCPMTKEKRDVVRQMAERWKLTVHAAGWEPKRFLVVHVTPKSKAPARILGSKPGVPISAVQPPLFDTLLDMDPRLVISLLDLPGESDISALVLRFGGECELVWMNDKNALAVFADPARAATALRRLDNGTPYHGAVSLLQHGGASGCSSNVWGAKDVVAAVPKSSGNPWKKAVASPGADSWVGIDKTVPTWKVNEAPIPASMNRWKVLGSDAILNHKPSDCSGAQNLQALSDSGQQSVGGGESQMGEEVDDWEKAYE